MRLATRVIALLPILGGIVACHGRPTGMTQAERDGAAASAKAVVATIFQKSNQLDFAGALALYSSDPDARYVENGVVAPSLDALKQEYAELGPTLESINNTLDSGTTLVLDRDAVAVTVPVHFRIKAKGRPEYSGQYAWSGIVQRRHGTWQLVQSHESWVHADQVMEAITPAPTTPATPRK